MLLSFVSTHSIQFNTVAAQVLGPLEKGLRSAAELGAWQLISPVDALGRVLSVEGLHEIQDEVRSWLERNRGAPSIRCMELDPSWCVSMHGCRVGGVAHYSRAISSLTEASVCAPATPLRCRCSRPCLAA